MGCNVYDYKDREIIFIHNKYAVGCLCTFPMNYKDKKLDSYDVKAMAWLGAAIALLHNRESLGEDEYVRLPHDLPDWVVEEINRLIPNNENYK